MTDTPEIPDAPEPAAGTPGPRPERRPGAAAASRARRIGGRPVPARAGGEPVPLTKPDAEPAAEAPAAPADWMDPDDSVAPAPTSEPASTATLPVPTWLNWAPAGVLVAGCVVMAVLLLIFSHGVWWGPDPAAAPRPAAVDQKREQVLAAAKSCVVAANDYDYRQLAAYEKRALACTTGELTSKLQQTIEKLIMKNAPTIKAKQTTQITRGGIETVTPDGKQWTLLVFGNLSVVNSNYPKGRTDPFGAQVRVEKAHGKWVMSGLSVVSSPAGGG